MNIMILKAAVLLGSPKGRASKEMGEVVEFVEKLFNLTNRFCPEEKYEEQGTGENMINTVERFSVRSPLKNVGHLQTVYPEVNDY